jgi:TPR repeat protein
MRVLIAAAAVLAATSVQAYEPVVTFERTLAAYERGEHELARERFAIQAAVGFAEAQFNYGVMLARGEGGERDAEAVKGWIALSASQG